MDDFVNAIGYEVKQEIANRYFGFRSRIEAETGQYLEQLHQADRDHLDPIRLDLRRMRLLLHRKELYRDFLYLVKLPDIVGEVLFHSLPDASEVFCGLKGEGLTSWRRFRDLAFKVYQSLVGKIAAYRQASLDLGDEYSEICASIDAFHRNNDLSGILSFLRTFDSPDTERLKFVHTQSPARPGQSLDQELKIPHPPPATDILPEIPALPALKQIKTPLTALLKPAFDGHGPSHDQLPF